MPTTRDSHGQDSGATAHGRVAGHLASAEHAETALAELHADRDQLMALVLVWHQIYTESRQHGARSPHRTGETPAGEPDGEGRCWWELDGALDHLDVQERNVLRRKLSAESDLRWLASRYAEAADVLERLFGLFLGDDYELTEQQHQVRADIAARRAAVQGRSW